MKCVVQIDTEGRLIPATEHDAEEMAKLRPRNHYKCNITRARNPDHHRKGMRLLRDVFENQDRYETFDDLLIEFKLCTGWYAEHITTKGVLIYVPRSIEFANMDQTEFEEFYSRAIDVAIQRFGFTPASEYA